MSLTAQRPMNDVCATRPDGRNYFKRKQFSPVAASGVLLQMGSWREPPAGEEVEGGHWVAGPALAAGGLQAERLSSWAPPGTFHVRPQAWRLGTPSSGAEPSGPLPAAPRRGALVGAQPPGLPGPPQGWWASNVCAQV